MQSRQYRFRAWDKRNSIMYTPYAISEYGEPLMWSEYDKTVYVEEYSILMQFTGLLDKNGKEIYEGDIVENSRGYKELVEWVQEEGIDAFRYTGWSITTWYDKEISKYYTIIGNIYEDPELLH